MSEPNQETRDIFAKLAAPFPPGVVKERSGGGGRKLSFISARDAMNRLDEVLGPENWWDRFIPWGEHALICELTIRLPDGTTVTKSDGGGRADMSEADNDDKSAFSDAFKRAAVKFLIARYLYKDGLPDFAGGSPSSPGSSPPSSAPPRSAPSANGQAPRQTPPATPPSQRRGNWDDRNVTAPPPGKAVFARLKALEEYYGVDLVKPANQIAKGIGAGWKSADWDENQIGQIYVNLVEQIIMKCPNYGGEFDPPPLEGEGEQVPDPTPPSKPPADPLTQARRDLYRRAKEALVSQGNPAPSQAQVLDAVASMSRQCADRGGEVIADLGTCPDEGLIRAVTEAFDAALADDIPF